MNSIHSLLAGKANRNIEKSAAARNKLLLLSMITLLLPAAIIASMVAMKLSFLLMIVALLGYSGLLFLTSKIIKNTGFFEQQRLNPLTTKDNAS